MTASALTHAAEPVLRGARWRAATNPTGAAWAAAVAVMVVLAARGRADVVSTSCGVFVAGLGIVVTTGWGRQPNLGQFGFMGVGAFAAAWLDGWPWIVRLLAAALAAAIAAAPVGIAAGRVSGLALGALTLLTGVTIWSLGRTPAVMGFVGGSNTTGVIMGKPPWAATDAAYAGVSVTVALVAVAFAVTFKHSRTGRAMTGLGTSPRALIAEGWNPPRLVLLAFMGSAAFGGVAGVLVGTGFGSLSSADIDPLRSVLVYAQIAVLGTAFTSAAAVTAALLAVFALWSLPTDWLALVSGAGLVLAGASTPAGYLAWRRVNAGASR